MNGMGETGAEMKRRMERIVVDIYIYWKDLPSDSKRKHKKRWAGSDGQVGSRTHHQISNTHTHTDCVAPRKYPPTHTPRHPTV